MTQTDPSHAPSLTPEPGLRRTNRLVRPGAARLASRLRTPCLSPTEILPSQSTGQVACIYSSPPSDPGRRPTWRMRLLLCVRRARTSRPSWLLISHHSPGASSLSGPVRLRPSHVASPGGSTTAAAQRLRRRRQLRLAGGLAAFDVGSPTSVRQRHSCKSGRLASRVAGSGNAGRSVSASLCAKISRLASYR